MICRYTLKMGEKNGVKKEFRKFEELTLKQLYEIIKLRVDVFVVEQGCPYSDLDNKDQEATHFTYTLNSGRVIGYLRILNKGVSYKEVSISRVIIDYEFRAFGYGHDLLKEALDYIEEEIGEREVRISAQKHLQSFYSTHGFKTVGKEYLEDNIPHVQMERMI